jgi:hypothetical protein
VRVMLSIHNVNSLEKRSTKMVAQDQPPADDTERMRQRLVERIAHHLSLVTKHRKIIRRLEARLDALESRIELLVRTVSR